MEAFLMLDENDLCELGITHTDSQRQILTAISDLSSNNVSLSLSPCSTATRSIRMPQGSEVFAEFCMAVKIHLYCFPNENTGKLYEFRV